jgi:hypothetical protein
MDTYLVSTVNSDVEELDFTHVFSSSSKEAKSSEKNIHVCHETDGLYGMTRVTPSASMRIKPEKRFFCVKRFILTSLVNAFLKRLISQSLCPQSKRAQ